ncbi:MAG: C39 family peptidase [Anaerolineales bacterium]|nr:C39 family peptidase [Anaerolineales bacterium]
MMRERAYKRKNRTKLTHTPKFWIKLVLSILVIIVSLYGVYRIPYIHDRLSPRLTIWKNDLFYMINPPEEAVFIPNDSQNPEQQIALMVSATISALDNQAQQSTPTPTLGSGEPTLTSAPPTPSPTPLPSSINLQGVKYMDQHGVWNYCGPANLAMLLSYWGWEGNRYTTGEYLRGGLGREDDKNVMPYEMQAYVEEETDLRMIIRSGGDIHLLKTLIANGYPVLVEKSYAPEGHEWMGHFLTLTGYSDQTQEFISQDSYLAPDTPISYTDLKKDWRSFNYVFLVAYSPDKETELFTILGNFVDETWAYEHAKEIAYTEANLLTGIDEYFAWFNIGTSHTALLEYVDAAFAFDYSFNLYATLDKTERPWRILWYETGPYKAYFYSGRYQDVINLVNTTLDTMQEPILEESFYWRGLAYEAMGNRDAAITDIRESVRLNPYFVPGYTQLERLGVTP